jgi:2'-5' RNA ligase
MSAHPHLPTEGFCIRNVQRDFVEWHRGRSRYVLWGIDVDLPALTRRIAAAQTQLDGLLLAGYERQPHITLALCGFPGAGPFGSALLPPDEFGAQLLNQQITTLQRTQPKPFEIEIGDLSSFASAPYLSVTDACGGIETIRSCLDPGSDTHAYTPHVTVGLYADAWSTPCVRSKLMAFTQYPALPMRVARIGLFAYEASVIGGPLMCLATYSLSEKRLHWHSENLFEPKQFGFF